MKKLLAWFMAILAAIPAAHAYDLADYVVSDDLEPRLAQLAPLCFSGEADYWYRDDGLAVHIKRFESEELVFHVADVQTLDASHFLTALSGDRLFGKEETTSQMAARVGAVIAINADYTSAHSGGVIIRNGELLRARIANSRNLLIVDARGDFSIIIDRKLEKPDVLAERLVSQQVWQTFEFGPALVQEGKAVPFSKAFRLISTSATRKEPRTAIGQIGENHYALVVVDGRKEGYSGGMTLPALQSLFIELGCMTAFNLDGGGSTTMTFMGEVIHRPGSGKERAVSDIIYFK